MVCTSDVDLVLSITAVLGNDVHFQMRNAVVRSSNIA